VARPGRGARLTKQTVARAAVELVDEGGLGALTMRGVAARLEVDPMALYRIVPDRDGLISDIVDLLLHEVDETEQPGETWDQTMRRVMSSEREMALRHPQAYTLVATAPTYEGPGLWNAHRLMRLVTRSGLSEDEFFDMWIVVDSWLTGFLLLETDLHLRRTSAGIEQSEPDASWAEKMAATVSERAFWRGLDRICAGVNAAMANEQDARRGQTALNG